MKAEKYLSSSILYVASMILSGCVPLKKHEVCYQKENITGVIEDYSESNLEKVLLIGIDGLRADAFQKASTLNIDHLAEKGAYSFKVQAEPPTWSGHGWSDVLTGVTYRKHGVVDNSFKGANYFSYPDVFTRLEELNPGYNTVALTSWQGLYYNIIGNSVDVPFYYPYKKDGDNNVVQEAVRILKEENPDVMFVYFSDVDSAGHKYGFDTKVPQYMAEIEDVDGQIGQILKAMQSRPNFVNEDWITIVVSDHGGTMEGHGGNSLEERTIPYIVSGESADNCFLETPRQVDVVPTIFAHLGIKINPAWSLDGKVMGLKKK